MACIRASERPTWCRSCRSKASRSKIACALANELAQRLWERLHVPVYLYEAAARRPDRVNLENIRRGQFEGLREEVRTNPDRLPDFGDAELHPSAGATVVGARKFLIAYNINLNTPTWRSPSASPRPSAFRRAVSAT
jgi:glutamate formiminotransferase